MIAEPPSVEMEVGDDGPGIPRDRRATLFRPFAAGDEAHGTGLGLYLCRRYLEMMGGSIGVGTSPLGGAAFTISLPLASAIRSESEPSPTAASSAPVPQH